MSKLNLPRDLLAKITQGNPLAIKQFERVFSDVSDVLPATIEEANALAGQALAAAQVALSMLVVLADALAQLESAPMAAPQVEADDYIPHTHTGTVSTQDHDSVEITGGTVGLDPGTAPMPSFYLGGDRTSGLYRGGVDVIALTIAGSQIANFAAGILSVWGNISASGQVVSNIATGTPPLVVNSVTMVPNLYAARASYADSASLGAPTTYPANASDLPSTIALVNALKAAAISKGL